MSADAKPKLNPLPDLGDVLFLLIVQLCLVTIPDMLLRDGSTGWHLVAGEYILKTGSIPHHDLISYTKANAPWVAYEWLTDVIMAGVNALAGTNGLAVLFATVIAGIFLFLYERCRRVHCHFLLTVLLVVVGAIASSVHWLARPHVFTFLCVYIVSTRLEEFRRGTISGVRLLAWLCPTMLLWVNLHPAFLLGFFLTGLYLACDLACMCTLHSSQTRLACKARVKWLLSGLAAMFALTIVNPYGLKLYVYIWHYLQSRTVLMATEEYGSPVFHGALQPVCLEILFALWVVGLVLMTRRPTLTQFAACLVFAFLALGSVRNVPLFVIVALPAIAESWAQVQARFSDRQEVVSEWLRKAAAWFGRLGSTFDEMEPLSQMHLLPIACVCVLSFAAVSKGEVLGSTLLTSKFDPERLPSTTLDCIRERRLKPENGLSLDNWGGYIRYKLGIPVFIDDRADFYGERFYLEYATVSTTSPGWSQILERNHIDWVLFPVGSRLAARLIETGNWTVVCQDKAAKLLTRNSAAATQ